MKISIITVCFNSEDTIRRTIESVASQDYHDIEHIIVDGKSTDNTLSIIEKYRKKSDKIVSETDAGIYDALNKGIVNASGDIVGILHSDDVFYDSHVVSKIAEVFSRDRQRDAIYGDLLYVKNENSSKIIRYWKAGQYKRSKWRWGWMPPHPTFFCKKECFEKFGSYNLDFWGAADYELMLRFLYKNRILVSYTPIIITKMTVGGQSNISLKNRLRANSEDRRAWKVNGFKGGAVASLCKPLRKSLQWILRPNTVCL